MSLEFAWQEVYRSALLELRPAELRQRIEEAEQAIRQRIAELRQGDSSSEEERRALDDALRALTFLAQVECMPAESAPSDAKQDRAMS